MNMEKQMTTEQPQSSNEAAGGASAVERVVRGDALALYEPPFRFEHGYIYDAVNNIVSDDHGMDTVGRVRGWGRISYLQNPEELQDTVGQLMAEALTEFWVKQKQTPNV